jgi:hypothetical protein
MLPPGLSRCGLLPAPAVEVSANAKEVNSAACCLDGHSTKLSTDTPQLTLANKPKREQPIEDEAESDEKGQLQAMPSSQSECKRTTREPAIQADKQTEKRCENKIKICNNNEWMIWWNFRGYEVAVHCIIIMYIDTVGFNTKFSCRSPVPSYDA